MNLEFAALQENIEACEAQIAASDAVLDAMAECLTSGTGAYIVTYGDFMHEADPFFTAKQMRDAIATLYREYESTSGGEIQPIHPTSADTPKGLIKVATDGERADGRLAWVPGV